MRAELRFIADEEGVFEDSLPLSTEIEIPETP